MQVFVSWSGERSRALAHALRDLLPDVLQNLTIWMSEHDLQAGVRWSSELSSKLSDCDVGIACVTPENQHSPWLMFEAGAISKSLEQGRLIPLLLDIGREQIAHPLAQFQLLQCDQEGVVKLISALNQLSDAPLDASRLQRTIERWWPDFSEALGKATALHIAKPSAPERADKEILYEILEKVRGISIVPIASRPVAHGIEVDTRPLVGELGITISIDNISTVGASDFLDTIWKYLVEHEDIPAFTYGSVWVLYNTRTQLPMVEIGAEYIASGGKKRDSRKLDRFGLRPGDILETRRVVKIEI